VVFSRGRDSADRPGDSDDDLDEQMAAISVADGFYRHDVEALAALTPAARAEQVRLREALYEYADGIWEGAKVRGLSPADLPEYRAVAGMRDLAMNLLGTAQQAQDDAGDDPDE
jgi:hypothetical protein